MELEAYKAIFLGDNKIVYLKEDADNVISELESENKKLRKEVLEETRIEKRALWLARAERASDRARIFYFCNSEMVLDIEGFTFDNKKKNCCKKLTSRLWRITWMKVERKCRAKAEEYK